MFTNIINFFQESYMEFKKLTWPNRKEAMQYTFFIIIFSLILAAVLGVTDFIFINLIKIVIIK